MNTRIQYLDGLRGVAILLVLGFHAFSRYPDLVPYGYTYEAFPLFQLGWLGVQLFFLISGFVIFMTLDKTKTFKDFLVKRWLRLFPGMLIASILIYVTAPVFAERPWGQPTLIDLLPGLTFTEPDWWRYLFNLTDIKELEGAFWSLYVEFKFYVIAGFIYFFLGRKFLIPTLLALFLTSTLTLYLNTVTDNSAVAYITSIANTFSLNHFGWFCSGATFYVYQQTKSKFHYLSAFFIAILSSLFLAWEWQWHHASIAAILITTLFATSLHVTAIQWLLTLKPILFFGVVSYPLYLLHENIMISTIIKLPHFLPDLNMFLYPFIPLTILALISYLIAKKGEPELKNIISNIMKRNHYPTATQEVKSNKMD